MLQKLTCWSTGKQMIKKEPQQLQSCGLPATVDDQGEADYPLQSCGLPASVDDQGEADYPLQSCGLPAIVDARGEADYLLQSCGCLPLLMTKGRQTTYCNPVVAYHRIAVGRLPVHSNPVVCLSLMMTKGRQTTCSCERESLHTVSTGVLTRAAAYTLCLQVFSHKRKPTHCVYRCSRTRGGSQCVGTCGILQSEIPRQSKHLSSHTDPTGQAHQRRNAAF